MSAAPRWLPDHPLPPYAYLPGRSPHPHRHPDGHAAPVLPVAGFRADRWRECAAYLRGHDLLASGFPWEAHEQWEAVWHAAGAAGPTADVLKGLILVAAAALRAREGRPAVGTHRARAAALFRAAAVDGTTRCGLDLVAVARALDAGDLDVALRP